MLKLTLGLSLYNLFIWIILPLLGFITLIVITLIFRHLDKLAKKEQLDIENPNRMYEKREKEK